MSRVSSLMICALVIPAILATETNNAQTKRDTASSNEYTHFEARSLQALGAFQKTAVKKAFVYACKQSETRLWWSLLGGDGVSFVPSFQQIVHCDGILLDVGCNEGRKLLNTTLSAAQEWPGGLPNMLLAASDNVLLTSTVRSHNLDGEFLGIGLVQVKGPSLEFPSVLRVAIPDEKMITDPVGAVIANRTISHMREALKLTLSFRRGNLSDLLSGNADLLVDSLIMDKKTMGNVAILSQQIWRLRTLVIMKSPGAMWASDSLFTIFEGDTWLATGGCVLATALALRIVAFWESRDVESAPEIKEENNWSSSLITAIGMTCAQGFNCSTNWTSARICLVTFEVFSLFVGLFYSTAMVTLLLTLPESKILSAASLEDWPLSIAVDPAYLSIPNLLESQDPIVRNVIGLKGESMSLWNALQVAAEEPIAFLSEEYLTLSTAGASLEVSNICRLQSVILQPDQPLFLVGSKMMISPWLKEQFRRIMLHVAEIGFLSGDVKRAIARPLFCLQSDVTDTTAIGTRAMWPAMAILGVGHLLALTLLLIEFGVNAWPKYKPLHNKAA